MQEMIDAIRQWNTADQQALVWIPASIATLTLAYLFIKLEQRE